MTTLLGQKISEAHKVTLGTAKSFCINSSGFVLMINIQNIYLF